MKTPPETPSRPAPAPLSEDSAASAVKGVFDAKASEPVPEHLVSLVRQLEAEGKDDDV